MNATDLSPKLRVSPDQRRFRRRLRVDRPPVSGREPITHFTGTNVVGPICLATGEREKTEKLVTEK